MSQRICIYGTGAIGGFLAARLADTGLQVSCVARGAQLRAIRSDGLRLIEADGERRVDVACTDSPAELGAQDIVIVALKASSLVESVDGIVRLMGPDTTVVAAQNGIPWWYFHQDTSGFDRKHLACVDPDGRIWNSIGPARAIGAVVYPSARLVSPGVVRHVSGDSFTIGEPGDETSDRIVEICELLSKSGLQVVISNAVRDEIWLKLSVNAAINPLSLIRGCTIGEILSDRDDRRYLAELIAESSRVADSLGVTRLMSPEELTVALEPFGIHKTSMLIDFEHGRKLEVREITGAVLEIAQHMGVETPKLTALYSQVEKL